MTDARAVAVDRAQWIALHLPQLEHYHVPQHLHARVFDCIYGDEGAALALEAVAAVERIAPPPPPSGDERKADWSDRQQPRRRQRVVATRALQPEEIVWRVDHSWVFRSAADAQQQLKASEETRERMSALVAAVIAVAEADKKEGDETQAAVDAVMKHLHLLAYSIRFGHKSTDMSYYVLNATGSSLRESKAFNLQVAPVFCVLQQKLFSVAWPIAPVAAGEELVRPYAAKISMMALCKKDYWEARYEGEDEYDWYCQYAHVRGVLGGLLAKTARVLVAGSGTSRLPIDMALDGFTDVHAMDFAANVVRKMQARCAANAWPVTFVETDMTDMEGWASNSVDCIIDKGCLDTMLLKPETDAADDDNWKQVAPDSSDDVEDARHAVLEAARVLRPDGFFVLMTFGSPANRIHLFDWTAHRDARQPPMEWEVRQCLEMEPGSELQGFSSRFYLFVAQKKTRAD